MSCRTNHAYLMMATSLLLVVICMGQGVAATEAEEQAMQSRLAFGSGTLSLDQGSLSSLLIVVPILAFIVILDLAIFGVFSSSPEGLNRVSRFFFHVKEGSHILSERLLRPYRRRNNYYYDHDLQRYRRDLAAELQRSLLSNLSPVLEALSAGHKKYEEEEPAY